jgi:heterodisulfide reductase subunit A-like polyferredoxin
LLTLLEVKSISGKEGNFEVEIIQHSRYVDPAKCIACGLCAEKWPTKVDIEYDVGLGKRKSIYIRTRLREGLKRYSIEKILCQCRLVATLNSLTYNVLWVMKRKALPRLLWPLPCAMSI